MKSLSRFFFPPLIAFILLAACSSGEDRLSQEEIDATAAQLAATMIVQTAAAIPPTPTNTLPPPTETPSGPPEATATSTTTLFRDDFDGALRPEWSWMNEVADRWTISDDGWLEITGEDASLLYTGTQSNLLFIDIPTVDFDIRAHVMVAPTLNFQQGDILIYGDANNYVMVSRAFCKIATCGTDGPGIFFEYKIAGQWQFLAVPEPSDEVTLRLVSQGGFISGYYQVPGGDWIQVGKQIQSFFTFSRIGLGASNVDTSGVDGDVLAQFDYFEVLQPQP